LIALSCGKPTEENVTAVKNGAFKVYVRSQEFLHSGIRNVDICVAGLDSKEFPGDKLQCFLHGYDFSGLSVKWLSERELEVAFDCGRVTSFRNFAVISKGQPLPLEFHVLLHDACGTKTYGVTTNDSHR
jgi:hypothetical protein